MAGNPSQTELREILGGLLETMRDNAGVKQSSIARQANYSEATVSFVESGARSCTRKLLLAYFELCRPTPEQEEPIVAAYNATKLPTEAVSVGFWKTSAASVDLSFNNAILADSNMSELDPFRDQPEASAAQPRAVGGDFVLKQLKIEYNMPKVPGEPRETLETRVLEALDGGVQWWQMQLSYTEEHPDRQPKVSLFGEGDYEIIDSKPITTARKPGHILIQRVTFPKILDKGDITEFTLCTRRKVEFGDLMVKGAPDQREITPVVPIEYLKIAVRFPNDHRPVSVWHYGGLAEEMAPGELSASNALVIDRFGRTCWDWHKPAIGNAYGIAWQW